MHQEQRRRAHDLLRSRSIPRALFASSSSVKWLTGCWWGVQLGPNLHAGAPPIVLYEDGQWTLFAAGGAVFDDDKFAAQPGCEVITHEGYTIQKPITGAENLLVNLKKKLGGSISGKIGVESYDVPAFLYSLLNDMAGGNAPVPVDGWLEPLRVIKTAEEIEKLRANFALSDLGHEVARKTIKPGLREIDVWAEVHSAIQKRVGQRVPFGNDLIVAHRQANVGGWPLDHAIKPNDAVIVDLSTILYGYWSDSCATYYGGEPSDKQVKMHRHISEALQYAISLLKPGAVAREIDQKVRAFITDAGYPVYPHHTGHAVGVTGHEAPRIVPYNDETLQEGMVLMVEPGTYFPGETGVRLEDAVLITANGAEVITTHDKSLP